jgi:hypothetical protein
MKLSETNVNLELLDFDAAKNLSEDAVERLRERFRNVEKTCRKLSMEIDIGLPDEEAENRFAASGRA